MAFTGKQLDQMADAAIEFHKAKPGAGRTLLDALKEPALPNGGGTFATQGDSAWVGYIFGNTITLDGDFTVEELRALADWLEKNRAYQS